MIKKTLGEDAYERQLTYLKETKMPAKMDVETWIERVKAINQALPLFKTGEDRLEDRQLIKEVIIPNLPSDLRIEIMGKGAKKCEKFSKLMKMIDRVQDMEEE